MKLVVGLGNPGTQYENTRHNIGFLALDYFIEQGCGSCGEWHESKKLGALVSKGTVGKHPVMLIKPQEFYNNTGSVLQKVMAYYKATIDDIIVVHDDIDLQLGSIKITNSSSAAGNNGVQSIIDVLKSQNFRRVRVGVSNDSKDNMEAQDFVLGRFTATEKKTLKDIKDKINSVIIELIEKHPKIDTAQNKFH